jgi:hypothetical protein
MCFACIFDFNVRMQVFNQPALIGLCTCAN